MPQSQPQPLPSADEPDCIFCKIIRKEIPSAAVLETDHALVFLDINPVNPGHLLLVPKHHHRNLIELPDSVAAEVGSLLPRLCKAVQAATSAEGFNLVVNNGEVAGQTVFHGHWHIIPRFTNDPIKWPWPQGRYEAEELGRMRDSLQKELGVGG